MNFLKPIAQGFVNAALPVAVAALKSTIETKTAPYLAAHTESGPVADVLLGIVYSALDAWTIKL